MKLYIFLFIFTILMFVGCRDKHQDDECKDVQYSRTVSTTTTKVLTVIGEDNADELTEMIKSRQISSHTILESFQNLSIFNFALRLRMQRCIEVIWRKGGAENQCDPYQTWQTLCNLFNVVDDSLRERILTELLVLRVDFEMRSPFGTQRTIIEELEYKKDEIVGFFVPSDIFDTYIQQLQKMTVRCRRFKEERKAFEQRRELKRKNRDNK